MDDYGWKTLRERLVGGFSLREIELPTGKRVDYIVVSYPTAVGVLAFTEQEQLIMVGQYRYAVGGYSWEIPTGSQDEGESLEECARRELEQETGYRAEQIEPLFTFHPSNGATDQVVHLYLALNTKKITSALKHEEPIEELIEVKLCPFKEVLSEVLQGKIRDAATVIAVLLCAGRFGA